MEKWFVKVENGLHPDYPVGENSNKVIAMAFSADLICNQKFINKYRERLFGPFDNREMAIICMEREQRLRLPKTWKIWPEKSSLAGEIITLCFTD